MSKQKLHYTRGYLLTNAGRLGTPRTKTQIEPKDETHANDCGCVSCRITAMADEAIDRALGGDSDLVGNALPPAAVVLTNEGKRAIANAKGPLLLPRGVLAGDAK